MPTVSTKPKINKFLMSTGPVLRLLMICKDFREGAHDKLLEKNPETYCTIHDVLKPLEKKVKSGPVSGAGIFKQSMGAKNRLRIGLSYRPPRVYRLAELIPWNRFLGSLKDVTVQNND